MVAPTLLSIWDCPTRMRTLEARMETQKLSRMMERSDLMNLRAGAAWGQGASPSRVPVLCPPHMLLAGGHCPGQPGRLSHPSATGLFSSHHVAFHHIDAEPFLVPCPPSPPPTSPHGLVPHVPPQVGPQLSPGHLQKAA